MINGRVSHWFDEIGLPEQRARLDGPKHADVLIVGAGFSGLWTAYFLKKLSPSTDIIILEKDFAGFGASGRNGGWLSSLVAGHRGKLVAGHGVDSVRRLELLMMRAVDDVIGIAENEGIKADVIKSGMLHLAFNQAQAKRLAESVIQDWRWGRSEQDVMLLSEREVAAHVSAAGAIAGTFSPHAARVQPAKLVRGLAAVVEKSGVRIFEGTPAVAVREREVDTPFGSVSGNVVLRCTEGYTAGVSGEKRTLLPMNSAMIATEPLSERLWSQIGWAGHELLGDAAHGYTYAQRTASGRIAIGGRGVPYRFGSRWDSAGQTQRRTVRLLHQELIRRFPMLSDTRIDRAWCGVLGVPRDWCASVSYSPSTGLGHCGGYAGHGVTTAYLAGRTLADLVLERQTELTELPWVDRTSRRWEPEPLRWAGVQTVYGLYGMADHLEGRGREKTALPGRLADALAGRG